MVTLEEDKIKLSNWADLRTHGLSSVDWIKKGEVDIIRCGKLLIIPIFSLNHSPFSHPISRHNFMFLSAMAIKTIWFYFRSHAHRIHRLFEITSTQTPTSFDAAIIIIIIRTKN